MGALDRYLLGRVIGAFCLVFLAVAGIAATLDILANADEAVESAGGAGGLWSYAWARLPLIALKLAPIAALLAALIALLSLVRTGELAAAAALGASQVTLARALLPAAAAIGFGIFAIGEYATPPAAAKLRAMGLDPFAEIARPSDAVWLKEKSDVVRIARISEDENRLFDITIYRRDPEGRVIGEIQARSADRMEGGWRFRDVALIGVDGRAPERITEIDWPTTLGPKSYKTLAAHPQELAIETLRDLAGLPGASPKPPFFYDLWIQRKYAGALSAALMLMLAVPFAGRLARGKSLATPLAVGLVVGFAYFVLENLAVATAESGAISPAAGAWGPPIALTFTILALSAFKEKPG